MEDEAHPGGTDPRRRMSCETLRYAVAACQVDQPNPEHRSQIRRNTATIVSARNGE